MQTEKAVYLFCLARAGLLPDVPMSGLDIDTPLLREDVSGVSAVFSEVPLEEFSGPAAEVRLTDLAWIGPRALRHSEVIKQAMHYSPVYPARFGTLFSSTESLRRLLNNNLLKINAFLDHVMEKEEWAVKVNLSREEAVEKLFAERLQDQSDAFASMSQGIRYFKERQLRAAVEREISSKMKGILEDTLAELTECSADWQRREVVFHGQDGSDAKTVANWAFLVHRADAECFSASIVTANAQHHPYGIVFNLSGPWPPYSFVPALKMETDG